MWQKTYPVNINIFANASCTFNKNHLKQECIPVGCVPAARRPFSEVCCSWGGLVPGVCVWSGGVCVWSRGVWSRGGVCQEPPPGPDQVPHRTRPGTSPLLTESQTGVKILPWPNFVAAGN